MLLLLMLGVGSGLLWGTGDFLGGLQSRSIPAFSVVFWSQLTGGFFLLLLLVVHGSHPQLSALEWGAGAGAFGGVALLFFYRGLAVGLMSLVAPVSACGAVLPVLVALATGHAPGLLPGAGMVAALAGIVVVSLHPGSPDDTGANHRTGLLLALGAALGFGMFFVLIHQGSTGSGLAPLWAVVGVRGGSLVTLSLIIGLGRQPAPWPGRRMPVVALAGILDTSANLLFAYASVQGNFGIAAVLGSLYPVATVVLGRIVLSERLARVQSLGVVLALMGVGLISTG